jgi:hypothetical protein
VFDPSSSRVPSKPTSCTSRRNLRFSSSAAQMISDDTLLSLKYDAGLLPGDAREQSWPNE